MLVGNEENAALVGEDGALVETDRVYLIDFDVRLVSSCANPSRTPAPSCTDVGDYVGEAVPGLRALRASGGDGIRVVLTVPPVHTELALLISSEGVNFAAGG